MKVASIRKGRAISTGAVISTGSRGSTMIERAEGGRDEDALRELRARPELVGERVAVAHLQGEADAGGHHRRRAARRARRCSPARA